MLEKDNNVLNFLIDYELMLKVESCILYSIILYLNDKLKM